MIINFALASYFLIYPSISGFIILACKPIQFYPITGYSTMHSELTTLQTVFNRLRGTFSFLEALIIAISIIFSENPDKFLQSMHTLAKVMSDWF